MTTPQMDWLDDERRRSRNATPWLPPLSCDPRLVSVPRVGGLVTHYIVRNGPGGMAFTYDDLRRTPPRPARHVETATMTTATWSACGCRRTA